MSGALHIVLDDTATVAAGRGDILTSCLIDRAYAHLDAGLDRRPGPCGWSGGVLPLTPAA